MPTETTGVYSVGEDLESGLVAIDSIYRDPANINVHDETSLQEIAASLREFGQVTPIVVNEAGMIVKGNGTHEAAEKLLGWSHIAVVEFKGSEIAQLRYSIADNATARLSHFKEDDLMAALEKTGALPGFNEEMLDAFTRSRSKEEQQEAAFNVADAYEADPTKTVVRPGQLWQLGGHRILCASCLHPDSLPALMGDEEPGLVFADPPYGIDCVKKSGVLNGRPRKDPDAPGSLGDKRETGTVGFDIDPTNRGFGDSKSKRQKDALLVTIGGTKPFGSNKAGRAVAATQYMPVIGDETTETAYDAFLLLHGRPDQDEPGLYPRAVHVWWGANHYAGVLPDSSQWLFWNKEMTGNFAAGELAYMNGKKAVRMFTHQWNGLMKASERGTKRVHPNQKPTALAAYVFENYGVEDMLVLDPFLGSAPTIWAAETMGLRVYGCELSPEYCSLIVAKWEGLTGESAVLIAEGVGVSQAEREGD